ncbi:hypothetical protein ACSFCX_25675, partial [Yokenella regensburgei]|uniref:hypothetical protein n=1 Tax=Yokenella regensburgei TaxID=158877 RepID=UPI003ED95ADE
VDQRTGQAVKGLKCHRVFPLVLTPLTGREVMAVTLSRDGVSGPASITGGRPQRRVTDAVTGGLTGC